MLVNHYKFNGRSHLTAQLSTDDGKIWNDRLLLDERSNVSYPDGVQSKDGLIRIVYDHDRLGDGEILLAAVREKDAMAGKNVSVDVRLKQVIQRLEKPVRNTEGRTLLLPGWDPKAAADRVLKWLARVTGSDVKGAHDADMVLLGDRAYVVSMANEVKPGENPEWPYIYVALAVVNMKTMHVEKIIPVARGGGAVL